MICTSDGKNPHFIANPDKAIFGEIIIEGDFKNCAGFKKKEDGPDCFYFPPPSVIINKGGRPFTQDLYAKILSF